MNWQEITPEDAVGIDCTTRLDLNPPHNEFGEVCPWPWDPQQLKGLPLGQYHCPYCGAMVLAGSSHVDYGEDGIQDDDSFTMSFRQDPDDDSFMGPVL